MKRKILIIVLAVLIGILVYMAKGSFPFIYTTIAVLIVGYELFKRQS